jgi:hypothetical protein
VLANKLSAQGRASQRLERSRKNPINAWQVLELFYPNSATVEAMVNRFSIAALS